MVPENTAPAWLPLRSVTQRLTSIPVTQLPQVVPFLASTISSSGTFLAEINSLTQKKRNSEEEITAHKLKTQVSTLLQDENKEARWAAVVLVKAMIEVGGWGLLQDSGHWIRALLGLIGVSIPRILFYLV